MSGYNVGQHTSNPWTNQAQGPNVNFQMLQLDQYGASILPHVNLALAMMLSQQSTDYPLSMYTFNRMAYNNWNNQDYMNLIQTCIGVCAEQRAQTVDAIWSICLGVIKHMHVIFYLEKKQQFDQILDPNIANQLYQYALQAGMINQQSYGGGFNNTVQYNPGNQANYKWNSTFAGNQPTLAGSSPDLGNKLSGISSRFDKGDGIAMNENIHSGSIGAGTRVYMAGAPADSNARKNDKKETEQPSIFVMQGSNLSPVPSDHVELSYKSDEPVYSFKDLADDVLGIEEQFISNNPGLFKYIHIPNFKYACNVSPYSLVIKNLNLLENIMKYYDGKIESPQIKDIDKTLPARFRPIIDFYKSIIVANINTVLATSKIDMMIDMDNENLFNEFYNVISILGLRNNELLKDEVRNSVKFMHEKTLKIEKVVVDGGDKENTNIVLTTDVIVVNRTKEELRQMSLSQLEFLWRLSKNFIFMITLDSHLFTIEMCSSWKDENIQPYTIKAVRYVSALF